MARLVVSVTVVAVVVALKAQDAKALCDQTTATVSDADTAAALGCDIESLTWFAKNRNTPPNYWNSRGYTDACNVNKEFTKAYLANMLLARGIRFSVPSPVAYRSFHGGDDYNLLAKADPVECPLNFPVSLLARCWHPKPYSNLVQDVSFDGPNAPNPNVRAEYAWQDWDMTFWTESSDYLGSFCPNFDPPWGAASRAGTHTHEAWHGHWRGLGDAHTRSSATTATPSCPVDMDCDVFMPHAKDEYPAASLWSSDFFPPDEARTPHFAYQLEAEMACDLADLPGDWVPLSVRLEAETTAATVSTTRFYNGPMPFSCGAPTPLAGVLALIRSLPESCAIPCTVDSECTVSHSYCVSSCCIVIPE